MLLVIWLIGGLALTAAAAGLALAMSHAERRARRTLFRTLGLDAATVELLMARNRDVLAELALVRRQDLPTGQAAGDPPAVASPQGRAAIRLVHPAPEAAASPQDRTGDDGRARRRS